MTAPLTGMFWLLHHPELEDACLLSDAEYDALTHGAGWPDGAHGEALTLISLAEFLLAVRMKEP